MSVHDLAHGYFSRHYIQAFVLIFVGFGIAGAVAPAVELLLPGGL